MYNILEYVSSAKQLQKYINLGIVQTLERKEIEWIITNCEEDVLELFYYNYYGNIYLVPVMRYLITDASLDIRRGLYNWENPFDPSLFTYEELERISAKYDIIFGDRAVKYYIKMGYDNLIPKDYDTNDVAIIKHLEKLGRTPNYRSIVERYYHTDVHPHIIERCIKLGIRIGGFYPTVSNVREIIKHKEPEHVWSMLNTISAILYTDFLDILYENHIPMYPSLSNYIYHKPDWTHDHIHYFPEVDILREYIETCKIRLDIMEMIDYSSIVCTPTLNKNSYGNIKKLRYELHEDNVYKIDCRGSDGYLLQLSYLGDVKFWNLQTNIANTIRILHYLPGIPVEDMTSSDNDVILEAVRLYGDGYRTLCRKHFNSTVGHVMELVSSSIKIILKPGFEDILVATLH